LALPPATATHSRRFFWTSTAATAKPKEPGTPAGTAESLQWAEQALTLLNEAQTAALQAIERIPALRRDLSDIKYKGCITTTTAAIWMLSRAQELAGDYAETLATAASGEALARELSAREPNHAESRNAEVLRRPEWG
jgi:hypothetical protein